MSQENLETVLKGFDAFVHGDREEIEAVLDPEVAWYPALSALLEHTSYHGPEAVCRLLLEEIPAVLEGFRGEILDLEDLGDAVLATARMAGTSRSTGLPIEQKFFQLYRMRNGKAIEMRAFTSRDDALEAAGLRE